MQKQRKSVRGLSFLLVLTMIVGMLQVGQISALAVGGVTNQTVSDALDELKKEGKIPSNANDVHYLDFRNNAGVMGDVDISQLTAVYPNLELVSLDGTNVQNVKSISSLPTGAVTAANTFYSGKTVSGGTVAYRESQGALKTEALVEGVQVTDASGAVTKLSPDLVGDGQISLDNGVTWEPLTVGGNVPDALLKELAVGSHSVMLDFPYRESTNKLQETVTLTVRRMSYVLAPNPQTMYQGGKETFTFTKLDEDGRQLSLGGKEDYEAHYSAGGVTAEITGLNTAGTAATVAVTAETYTPGLAGSGGQSGYVTVTKKGDTEELAKAQLYVQPNPAIDKITFEEHNESKTAPVDPASDTFYVRGGTSVGSVDQTNIIGEKYLTTTIYYLKDGAGNYISARYAGQFALPQINPTYPSLRASLEPVDSPDGSGEQVMGLTITSGYTAYQEMPMAITINLTNSDSTTANCMLNVVSLKATNPKGYQIYAVPGIFDYSTVTKDQLEKAIADGNDPAIKLAAQYKVSGADLVDTKEGVGVELVAGDKVWLVAAAYYEEGGQSFLLADDSISGWYDTQPTSDHLFGGGGVGRPLEKAPNINGSTNISSWGVVTLGYTKVLELRADGNSAGQEGKVILIPRTGTASMSVPVRAVEMEIDHYLFVPSAFTGGYPSGPFFPTATAALEYEKQNYEATGTVGDIYRLNVLKEAEISIGMPEDYRVVGVYNSNDLLETSTADWISPAADLVSIPADKAVIDAVTPGTGAAANETIQVAATSKGGVHDSRVGESAMLTLKDANGVTAELKVILAPSTINASYGIMEDYFGILYTTNEMLSHYSDLNLVSQTNPLEKPLGTHLKVDAVWAFSNEEYYDTSVDGGWKDYVVGNSNWNATQWISGNGGTGQSPKPGQPQDPRYWYIYDNGSGSTAGGTHIGDQLIFHNYLMGNIADPLPETINFDSYDHPVEPRELSSQERKLYILVTDPLVCGIEVFDPATITTPTPTPVPGGSTVNAKVGNRLEFPVRLFTTDDRSGVAGSFPIVSDCRNNVSMKAMLADGSSAVDYVNVDNDSKYVLSLLGDPGQNVKVSFQYTTTLNGVERTIDLNWYDRNDANGDITDHSVPYELEVAVSPATLEQVFLVAKGEDLKNTAGTATLDYDYGKTYQVYPVLADSRCELEDLTPPSVSNIPLPQISYQDVEAHGYLNFLDASTYSYLPNSTAWGVTGPTGIASGAPKVDEENHLYYEVTALDRTGTPTSAITFDGTQVQLTSNPGSGLFSAPVTGITDGTLTIIHTWAPGQLNVVDVLTAVQNAGTPKLGEPVEVKVEYVVSDEANVNNIVLPPSYFDVTDEDGNVISALGPIVDQKHGEPDANPNNVLRLEALSTPGEYTVEPNAAGNLVFTANQVGDYEFKLWTVNKAGALAPNYGDKYHTLSFTVDAVTAEEQTVRYSQTSALKAVDASGNTLVQPGTWIDIVETGGTKYLDAAALKTGVLKAEVNPATSAATTQVEYKNAAGKTMAEVPVKVVQATAQGARLSKATGPLNIPTFAPGEAFPLMWVVNYSFADGAPNATVNESVTDWQLHQQDDPSLKLNLKDDLVTVSGDVSGKMVYQATHTGSGTVELFWANLDQDAAIPAYNYVFSESDTDMSQQVSTLSLVVGDPAQNVYLWNADTGSLLGSLATLNVADTSVISAVTAGKGVKVTPISEGSTVLTVYPTAGGFAQLPVDVSSAPVPHYNVTGKVVATDGTTPVKNAAVTVTDGSKTYPATTDANGDFTVSVPDGTYTVSAKANGFGTATGSVTVSGANASAGTLTLPAAPTYQVTGTVQRYGAGNSVKNAKVAVTGTTGAYNAVTGNDGSFTVNNVPDGIYAVTISRTGFISYTGTVTVSGGNAAMGVIELVANSGGGGGGGSVAPDPGPDVPDVPDVPDHDCPSKNFMDVNTNAWYHEYVDYVVENGIMAGVSATSFQPNSTLTRAMMVQILYNMEGKPAVTEKAGFQDVKAGSWYEDAVAWAAKHEIVKGYTGTKFGPNDMVTREQMASILYRYADFKGEDVSARDGLAGYTDVSSISTYARSNVQWAVAKGLIQGRTSTTLAPKGTATRAEVATMITNYAKNIAGK